MVLSAARTANGVLARSCRSWLKSNDPAHCWLCGAKAGALSLRLLRSTTPQRKLLRSPKANRGNTPGVSGMVSRSVRRCANAS